MTPPSFCVCVFRAYLEKEISLSSEQISKYVEKMQLYVNYTLKELRRLFLVQDLIDSLKVPEPPHLENTKEQLCHIEIL